MPVPGVGACGSWPGRAGEPWVPGSHTALGGARVCFPLCRSLSASPPAVAKATFVFVSLWRSFAYGIHLLWGFAINIFTSVSCQEFSISGLAEQRAVVFVLSLFSFPHTSRGNCRTGALSRGTWGERRFLRYTRGWPSSGGPWLAGPGFIQGYGHTEGNTQGLNKTVVPFVTSPLRSPPLGHVR